MEKIAWWATVHGVAKSRTWLKQLSKHSTSSLPDYPHLAFDWASQVVLVVKNPSANIGEKQVQSLGWKDPLEKGMVIHSSTLTWRIPWTEKPGGLHSMGSQRVGHDWATNTSTFNDPAIPLLGIYLKEIMGQRINEPQCSQCSHTHNGKLLIC